MVGKGVARYRGLPTTPIILCVVVSVSGVEVGVEVICHSTFRSRYPFKKRIHVKSCLALNFVQKSPRGHMSIFPGSGTKVVESFV